MALPATPVSYADREEAPLDLDLVANELLRNIVVGPQTRLFTTYRNVFTGPAGTAMLMTLGFALTEEEAVTLGNQLIAAGYLVHAKDSEQPFKNKQSSVYRLWAHGGSGSEGQKIVSPQQRAVSLDSARKRGLLSASPRGTTPRSQLRQQPPSFSSESEAAAATGIVESPAEASSNTSAPEPEPVATTEPPSGSNLTSRFEESLATESESEPAYVEHEPQVTDETQPPELPAPEIVAAPEVHEETATLASEPAVTESAHEDAAAEAPEESPAPAEAASVPALPTTPSGASSASPTNSRSYDSSVSSQEHSSSSVELPPTPSNFAASAPYQAADDAEALTSAPALEAGSIADELDVAGVASATLGVADGPTPAGTPCTPYPFPVVTLSSAEQEQKEQDLAVKLDDSIVQDVKEETEVVSADVVDTSPQAVNSPDKAPAPVVEVEASTLASAESEDFSSPLPSPQPRLQAPSEVSPRPPPKVLEETSPRLIEKPQPPRKAISTPSPAEAAEAAEEDSEPDEVDAPRSAYSSLVDALALAFALAALLMFLFLVARPILFQMAANGSADARLLLQSLGLAAPAAPAGTLRAQAQAAVAVAAPSPSGWLTLLQAWLPWR